MQRSSTITAGPLASQVGVVLSAGSGDALPTVVLGELRRAVAEARNHGTAPPRLGRYELLHELGEGGMGIVFSARDPALRRTVAIKLLSWTFGPSSTHEKRLADEARLLAALSHPNVVPVFERGTSDWGSYIAMEFVEGTTLRQWLRAERSWSEIVAMFVATGRGLQAAHAAGIVHRDFKPDNVLVDREGRPKVADFGQAMHQRTQLSSASSSDPSSRDTTTAVAPGGTPAYMAPEQYRDGPIDARADQYAFCVALYEALDGERPFAGGPALAGLAQKLEGPPTDGLSHVPRAIARAVRRGLAVDPQARWPSMAALLGALQPKRSRSTWATATFGAGLAIALLGATLPEEVRDPCEGFVDRFAWTPERGAELTRAFATALPDGAGSVTPKVQQTLDGYAERWTSLRTEVCGSAAAGAVDPAVVERRLQCLGERRRSFEALLEAWRTPTRGAVALAAEAAARLPRLEPCEDDDIAAAVEEDDQIRTTLDRHAVAMAVGDYVRARSLATVALDRADQLGDRRARAIAALAVADADVELGLGSDAIEHFELAYHAAWQTDEFEIASKSARSLVRELGNASAFVQAERWMRHGSAAIDRLPPDRAMRARASLQNSWAIVLRNRGQHDEAIAVAERALAEAQRGGVEAGSEIPSLYLSLGNALYMRGRAAEAEAAHRKAADLWIAAYGDHHPKVAPVLTSLASSLHRQGKLAEARERSKRAVELIEQTLGTDHRHYALALYNYGDLIADGGDLEGGLERIDAALAVFERLDPEDRGDVSVALEGKASVLGRLRRFAEAREVFERVLALREAAYGPDHVEVGLAWSNLATLSQFEGNQARAEAAYVRALAIMESQWSEHHRDVASIRTNLGRLYADTGRPNEALAEYRRSLAIHEELGIIDHDYGRACRGAAPLWLERREPDPVLACLATAATTKSERPVSALTRARMVVFEARARALRGEHAAARALVERELDRLVGSTDEDAPRARAELQAWHRH